MTRALRAIEALEATLHREIGALEAGDFAALVQTKADKERCGAEVERTLSEDPGAVGRDRLFELKGLIEKTTRGLEEAMRSTQAVAEEVAQVRARHSTASDYGPGGTKHTNWAKPQAGFNKTF